MPPDGRLRAWIEVHDDGVLAAFVGVPGAANARVGRPPATQLCSSAEDARQWVEEEAKAFGLPVEWVDKGPP
ncbi:MAG TPA: hypothetical protein VNW90_16655 [Acetobacteraceae bacterium]|jgi:hypothetical protein|nr:hypothetical protein [Acetobacteraceae bacterium]